MKSTHTLKRNSIVLTGVLVALAAMLFVSACTDKVKVTRTYVVAEPVYTSLADVRSGIELKGPVEIATSGRIYSYLHWLLINEPGEGIHFIDNMDPENPVNKYFLAIPGNFNMAVRNNKLYADSYIDLVVFDILDMENIHEETRMQNVFLNSSDYVIDTELGIVTEYEEVERIELSEEEIDHTWGPFVPWSGGRFLVDDMLLSSSSGFKAEMMTVPASINGIGGSMARYSIIDHYLYVIENNQVLVFDILDPANVSVVDTVGVGWGLETIFPYKDMVFLGSSNGMHILKATDPAHPVFLSTYEHIVSCDPVVVDNDIAFVTLRSGTNCRNDFANILEVIDISNPRNPFLITSYNMENPHGLGVDGDNLFLCEGEFGLKIFDKKDLMKISNNLIKHYDSLHAYDVIPLDGLLLMIGNDGLYQYDYTDPKNIKLLSHIVVNNEASL